MDFARATRQSPRPSSRNGARWLRCATLSAVSFDVFFQRFVDGDALPGGGDRMRAVLEPFVVREKPDYQFLHIGYQDGTADVYLGDDGMMANHISGRDPWDLLVTGARAAEWVIMPVGCAVCITEESQRSHLPPDLDEEVALVLTGADLLSVIESA